MINKLTTKLSGMALLCISLSLFSQEKKEIKLENYFGDLSARQIGPAVMSGRISDMENHPTDPMIIYAGSAGGGVWKSNDAGTTFYPIFDDQYLTSEVCAKNNYLSRPIKIGIHNQVDHHNFLVYP